MKQLSRPHRADLQVSALLPLLPLRHLRWQQEHTSPHEGSLFRHDESPSVSLGGSGQPRSLSRELRMALSAEQPQHAVRCLQKVQAERDRGVDPGQNPVNDPVTWWMWQSVVQWAVGDLVSAHQFALQAWNMVEHDWTVDLTSVCRDSRADVVALLGVLRYHRDSSDRAVQLLHRAVDAHRTAGDIQQMAADHLLLSLILAAQDETAAAEFHRQRGRQIVIDHLDAGRHNRIPYLRRWLERHDQPRPWLLKAEYLT